MTGPKPPAPVCARCGMVIKYMLNLTGGPAEPEFVWMHGGPADHNPVLAPAIEPPRLYCDFCSAPDPDWVVNTDRDFQIITVAPDGRSHARAGAAYRGPGRRHRRSGRQAWCAWRAGCSPRARQAMRWRVDAGGRPHGAVRAGPPCRWPRPGPGANTACQLPRRAVATAQAASKSEAGPGSASALAA